MHSATLFKALSDPLRLRLLFLLTRRQELCVCHLVEALKLPQSTISRHLSQLRRLALVDTRREGKWVYYRLSENQEMVSSLLMPIVARLGEVEAQLAADEQRLSGTDCS